jgi:hypothetical protein
MPKILGFGKVDCDGSLVYSGSTEFSAKGSEKIFVLQVGCYNTETGEIDWPESSCSCVR